MSKKFDINDDEIEYISKKFNIPIEHITIFKDYFEKDCKNIIENQYLAHIIRLFEILIRKETENPLFVILLKRNHLKVNL